MKRLWCLSEVFVEISESSLMFSWFMWAAGQHWPLPCTVLVMALCYMDEIIFRDCCLGLTSSSSKQVQNQLKKIIHYFCFTLGNDPFSDILCDGDDKQSYFSFSFCFYYVFFHICLSTSWNSDRVPFLYQMFPLLNVEVI